MNSPLIKERLVFEFLSKRAPSISALHIGEHPLHIHIQYTHVITYDVAS